MAGRRNGMLAERLNRLMDVLDVSVSRLANDAGFHRTSISRLKSGYRSISASSKTAKRLVDAIYRFSVSEDSLDRLCSVIEMDPLSSADEICAGLSEWLFDGEEGHTPQFDQTSQKIQYSSFLWNPPQCRHGFRRDLQYSS